MIRRPPRSTLSSSSAASDVYKRQIMDLRSPSPNTAEALDHLMALHEGTAWYVARRLKALEHHASNGLVLFAFQEPVEGSYRFVATCYPALWERYSSLEAPVRHFYEVIPDGKPARLYLDVEYMRDANPDKDGDAMVRWLRRSIERSIESHGRGLACVTADGEGGASPETEEGGAPGEREDGRLRWVELDSSTSTKFSRHLTMPEVVFRDNRHMGRFMQAWADRVQGDPGAHEECQALLVEPDNKLCVDMGVYTKNRFFRVYGSTKFGRVSVLLPHGAALEDPLDRDVFMDSLICSVDLTPSAAPMLTVPETGGLQRRSGSLSSQPVVPREEFKGIENLVRPELIRFVEQFASKAGVPARVASCLGSQQDRYLVFPIAHNRWCGNVGRPHKSNGIKVVVDREWEVCYQKCFDPECRGYRSDATAVPPELLGHLQPPDEESQPCIDEDSVVADNLGALSDDALAAYMDSLSL
eukprot:TRINITY_DN3063_c0_g1_i1.p1 TRINITY_DN3063_c0_g1~~TRINITY_DN3063_c0_g1_i1.p1  ORF type:complete len:471 (+),score=105.01 TRINITY_DN3063_c0_g1_i1:138-1550(+)